MLNLHYVGRFGAVRSWYGGCIQMGCAGGGGI